VVTEDARSRICPFLIFAVERTFDETIVL